MRSPGGAEQLAVFVYRQLSALEAKTMSANQKVTDLRAEKETLEVELMAANEKLQLHVQRYQERKSRHRGRLRVVKYVIVRLIGCKESFFLGDVHVHPTQLLLR